MSLEAVLGATRAPALAQLIIGCVQEAYSENAARFSDELGDNNMTFATCVIHNLRHLLAEAVAEESGVRIERPDGSFQVVIGRAVLHFYKGRVGQAESVEIRFDESRTKRSLVRHNADQLALFDDDLGGLDGAATTHLVFVHAGDHVEGLRALWVGAPVVSGVNGFRWLWHEQIYGVGEIAITDGSRGESGAPWIDDSDLPDLIVEIRQPAEAAVDDVAQAP
jgi:hypothetical protein